MNGIHTLLPQELGPHDASTPTRAYQVTPDTPRDAHGIAARVARKRAFLGASEPAPFVPVPPRLTDERLRELVERATGSVPRAASPRPPVVSSASDEAARFAERAAKAKDQACICIRMQDEAAAAAHLARARSLMQLARSYREGTATPTTAESSAP